MYRILGLYRVLVRGVSVCGIQSFSVDVGQFLGTGLVKAHEHSKEICAMGHPRISHFGRSWSPSQITQSTQSYLKIWVVKIRQKLPMAVEDHGWLFMLFQLHKSALPGQPTADCCSRHGFHSEGATADLELGQVHRCAAGKVLEDA